MPQSLSWRAWKSKTILVVVSAAGRHDYTALLWIIQVEAHQIEDLEVPGNGWVTLDRKLAAALTNISHGELGRMLTLHSNACLNQGRAARGRVLLQLVFNHYSPGKARTQS